MNGRTASALFTSGVSDENKNYRVTPEMFSAHNPTWDPSGAICFTFSVIAEYAPLIGSTEFNYATNRMI